MKGSYNAAISACEKEVQPEQALEVLREMQRQSVEPEVISYDAAMCACEKGARPELRGMQLQGVEPDVISCNAAISACARRTRSPSKPWSCCARFSGRVSSRMSSTTLRSAP